MTTNWFTQAEAMIADWTGAQRKMWEDWLGAMQAVGTTSPSTETWQKMVDTWHTSVRKALEAQITWTQFWADSISSMSGASPQIIDWSNQMLDVVTQWTAAQVQMSDRWFEAVKHANPTAMSMNWNVEELQKAVYDWQEASQQSLKAQRDWLEVWIGMQTKTGSIAVGVASSQTMAPSATGSDASPPVREVQPPQLETAPAMPPVEHPAASQNDTAPDFGTALVNINTATIDDLVALPGIGPALAKRIIDYRDANGPFQSIEGLTNVQGIGEHNMSYAHLITV